MKSQLLLLVSIFWWATAALPTHAQQRLAGKVLDNTQKPVEGAILSLLFAKDSLMAKTYITEADGKFEFNNLKPTDYRLQISQVGYQNYLSPVITLRAEEPSFDLPAIQLQPENNTLKEVTLTSQKPFIERKIDRTVLNPDALLSNAGANILEVLEKAPAIQLDGEGNISLKGKQGVMVFIDDKPTYIAAKDLPNYLRSLPAGSVETIEIMPNPPAKYDAAGNAGIINIRLKRQIAKGLNGSFSTNYGQGRFSRTNSSLNFNYRFNKINFFTNLSANVNNSYQDLTIWREYFQPTGERNSAFTQNSYIKKRNRSLNLKMGIDYYATEKSTFGFVVSGFSNPSNTPNAGKAQITDQNGLLTSRNEALATADETWLNGTVNANYSYKIDKKGKEISANLDYLYYDNNTTQSLVNEGLTPDFVSVDRKVLDSKLPSKIAIQTAKVDYTNPLPAGAKLEAGAKISHISTQNIANFFDVIDGIATPNYDFSNDFAYTENISAGYLNFSKEGKRFSFQAGLRYEGTAIGGKQKGNIVIKDSAFTRRYDSFFPTFFINYQLDSAGKHQVGFNYGRRINRPNYQDMNPFTYPMDRFTLYGGNPFLRPTFSQNFELSYTLNNAITLTAQYSLTKDVINETIEQGANIFYSRPGNIGQQISYGLSLNGTVQPFKWWTLQWYVEFTHNDFDALLYGQRLKNKGTYGYFAPTSIFQAGKGWSAEIGGFYQTSIYSGQFVLIPWGAMRLAVGKKILKDKGALKLGVSDLLYTNQPGGNIKGLANSTARWYSLLDSRVVTLAFSYRFNKGQSLKARQIDGSESERQRVR